MTIDPRIGTYFSILAAIVSALIGSSAEYTTLFGADNAKTILAYLAIANVIVSAVNGVLHAIPSKSGSQYAYQFKLGPKMNV